MRARAYKRYQCRRLLAISFVFCALHCSGCNLLQDSGVDRFETSRMQSHRKWTLCTLLQSIGQIGYW